MLSCCRFLCMSIVFAALIPSVTMSQDRGDRGRSDRNRGSFGGDSGRGGSPFGGPPGMGAPSGMGGPPGGFGGGFSGPPGGMSFGGPPGMGGPPGGFGGGFGGPPGSFGGDRSSRFGSMMDSNGNGKIDQEEIDRMPSFVRDMMKARGVELKAGTSLDDMRNSFRSNFGGGENSQPGQNGQPGVPAAKVLTPYKMKAKKPVTLTLPPAYSEVDSDFDGQIGMHEWLMTRRADLDQFDVMDTDHDGYLIPEELQAAEAANASQVAVASTEKKRLLIVSATPTKAPTQPTNAPPAGQDPNAQNNSGRNPWASGDPSAMATESFRRLDGNTDGFIDPDEWQQSRRTRAMFEQAGIRLEKMSLEQFTQHYVKLSSGGR